MIYLELLDGQILPAPVTYQSPLLMVMTRSPSIEATEQNAAWVGFLVPALDVDGNRTDELVPPPTVNYHRVGMLYEQTGLDAEGMPIMSVRDTRDHVNWYILPPAVGPMYRHQIGTDADGIPQFAPLFKVSDGHPWTEWMAYYLTTGQVLSPEQRNSQENGIQLGGIEVIDPDTVQHWMNRAA